MGSIPASSDPRECLLGSFGSRWLKVAFGSRCLVVEKKKRGKAEPSTGVRKKRTADYYYYYYFHCRS